MSSKKKNIYIFLGKVILITLLIVLFIRCFLIESFTVSSSQMESTLHQNDRILIDKTSYGIRLPITLLSIPFTFDNIFGMKSYSTLLQAPYTRLFTSQLHRNDIVLFNNPIETDKPLDKSNLLLGRCVALPGDSIEMSNGLFLVNKEEYVTTPNTTEEYIIEHTDYKLINYAINDLDIPLRNHRKINDTLHLQLNRYEAYMLKESLPDSINLVCCSVDTTTNYRLLVPSKGNTIISNENNLLIYKDIIKQEQKDKEIRIEDGTLLIDGIKQDRYTFEDDYYWLLSDNSINSMDSRHLGFIPFRTIIGKALTIWYNPDKEMRCNRCFQPIK
ncbi:MAG: signal peptidase I [Dysgonomonas sp.]